LEIVLILGLIIVPEEKVEVKSHTKKKPGRKPLAPEIPREEIIHDIPEEEKTCGCGCTS
jgi:transposase